MNKDPKYYQNLFHRLYERIETAQEFMDTVLDMKYEVENDRDPWDDKEEYDDIIDEIEGFLE